LPELGQNVDWLLNQCEKEPIANNKDLNHHKHRIKILEQEEQKLKILCQKESEEISTLNEILEVVEELEELHEKHDLNLDLAKKTLENLAQTYPKEYKRLQIPYVAIETVIPLLKSQLQTWDCLTQPYLYIEEFIQWRNILELNLNNELQTDPTDTYQDPLDLFPDPVDPYLDPMELKGKVR
jgi:hypothetical protein